MGDSYTAPVFSRPMHEAIFWRGNFVHHYSAIEQMITELIICCLSDPAFAHLGKVPGTWPEKLRRVGQIADQPGVLEPYAVDLRYQLSTISIIEPHRHLLVHGVMTVADENASPVIVNFMMHDAWKRARNELAVKMDDLRYLSQELGSHSQLLATTITAMLEAGNFASIRLGPPTIVKVARRHF